MAGLSPLAQQRCQGLRAAERSDQGNDADSVQGHWQARTLEGRPERLVVAADYAGGPAGVSGIGEWGSAGVGDCAVSVSLLGEGWQCGQYVLTKATGAVNEVLIGGRHLRRQGTQIRFAVAEVSYRK